MIKHEIGEFIQESQRVWCAVSEIVVNLEAQFRPAVDSLVSQCVWADTSETILELAARYKPVLERIRLVGAFYERYLPASSVLKNAGILPHALTPWMQFNSESPDEFPSVVLGYFEHNWGYLEDELKSGVISYNVSDQAKAAFVEALRCHDQGCYRASVLAVLTAIERESRVRFGIGTRGRATSLEELRALTETAPFGIFFRPIAPLYLAEVLNTHVYEHVNTDQDVEKFARNPIPNRHAAIHMHVEYNSSLSSLNAIIFADYVFSVLSRLPEPSTAHEMCA